MNEPYYADEHVQLYHGDMREILPELDVRADACITDPPYGVLHTNGKCAWDTWPSGWLPLVGQYTDSLWCFGIMRVFLERYHEFTISGWRMSQDVVWAKNRSSGVQVDRFRRAHEHVTHWYRGKWADVYRQTPRVPSGKPIGPPRIRKESERRPDTTYTHVPAGTWVDDGMRWQLSVLHAPLVSRGLHPTQKPTEILEPLIKYSVPLGGLVLDPFAGSASTLLAARTLGRRAIGIEASEEYCERAAQRLAVSDRQQDDL